MVKYTAEWQKIALGGLLHDIGKLIHRNDEYAKLIPTLGKQHQALSVWFYNELVKDKKVEDDELVRTVIQRHHESGLISEEFRVDKIKDVELKQMALLVSRADNYSSKERNEEGIADDTKSTTYKSTPLESIFAGIKLDKELPREKIISNFRLKPFDSETMFPSTNHKSNSQGELKNLIEDFVGEVYKIVAYDFHSLYTQLLFLIEKYTWCIPSDTQNNISDIPLYDHLKTTSAIALASYGYQMEFDKITQVRIKEGKDEKQFLIIGGSLSGIQSFIYNLGSQKNGAKRLRARSFYVKTLAELVAYRIIKDLELTPANIVMQAGGKFQIIAPNTQDTTTKLKLIEKELLDELYNKFKGEIYIALAVVEAGGNELNGDYTKLNEELNYSLDRNKKSKFGKMILNNPVFENKLYGKGQNASLCPICQKELFVEGDKCLTCDEQIKLGEKLPNTEYLAVLNGGKGDFSFLGFTVKLIEDIKYMPKDLYLLINYHSDNLLGGYPEIKGSYGGYIPTNSSKETLTFEDIADGSTGVKNLAILKADVDNLGDIFGRGLQKHSISRIANMSKLLDSFFSTYLVDLIIRGKSKKLDYKGKIIDLSKFYLVYAGGDDLLIVAPWNELIYFSKFLSDKFREFTNNKEFTISCGIHLMNHSDPFFIASEKAGDMEDLAKVSGKNGLGIWERYIPWDKFDEIFLNSAEKYSEYNEIDKVYTQSFVYRLLKYTEMAEKYSNDKEVWQLSFISKFNYDVQRNLKEKMMKKYNKSEKELSSVPQWSKVWKDFYVLDDNKNIDNNRLEFLSKYMRVILNYAVRKNRKGDN